MDKILFIMHMPPPVHGAAMVGQYIHDSSLINQSYECYYINPTTARSIDDIQKIRFSKFVDIYKLCKSIRNEIKTNTPKVVYFTANAYGMPFYKDFIVMRTIKSAIIKYCKSSRIVVHYHNKGVSNRQNRLIDNILYKSFFKGLKIILLSELLYKDVNKYVDKKDVYICHNGIPETLKYEPTSKRDNDIPKILFLSNLIVSKGVLILLDALEILKNKDIDFRCSFVGGESKEMRSVDFSKEVDKRGLTSKVTYEGRKYGDEKSVYLKEADIFVFPTYYVNEAFSLVNLEAMEYKMPIITTNEGGIPDMVKDGENGLIVQNRSNKGVDPKELANAIEMLLTNRELRKKMGEDGYLKFKNKFTLEIFEKCFVEILAKLCNQNKR